VPKSLKEALLEQLGALQERGLAPAEVPDAEEPDEPAFEAYSSGSGTALATRPRTAKTRRPDGARRVDQRAPRGRRNQFEGGGDEFEDPDRAGGRGKRPAKSAGGRFRRSEPEMDMAGAPTAAPAPMVSRTDLLRERAEQRRRDETERQEINDVLAEYRGTPVDDEAVTAFFAALTEEVGALPPLRVVLHATRAAQSDQPDKVGDQVRVYYRSARARRPQPVAAG
jgi:hypothetical protein